MIAVDISFCACQFWSGKCPHISQVGRWKQEIIARKMETKNNNCEEEFWSEWKKEMKALASYNPGEICLCCVEIRRKQNSFLSTGKIINLWFIA